MSENHDALNEEHATGPDATDADNFQIVTPTDKRIHRIWQMFLREQRQTLQSHERLPPERRRRELSAGEKIILQIDFIVELLIQRDSTHGF
jgi:hypothetical protein